MKGEIFGAVASAAVPEINAQGYSNLAYACARLMLFQLNSKH